jgi:threonine/homoserine/homoserine lactone efflux protein
MKSRRAAGVALTVGLVLMVSGTLATVFSVGDQSDAWSIVLMCAGLSVCIWVAWWYQPVEEPADEAA